MSQLVSERAEVFKERSGGVGGGDKTVSVKTVHSGVKGREKEESREKERGRGEGEGGKEGRDEEREKEVGNMEQSQLPQHEREGGGGGEGGGSEAVEQPQAPSSPVFSHPLIDIPVFSAPFMSSPWQPTCLRGQTISPFSDDEPLIEGQPLEMDTHDTQLSNPDSDSDSSIEEDLMKPLRPTSGMASISPMGKSWLSPGKPPTVSASPFIKPHMTGANEKSPFINEPYQRLQGQQRLAMARLSVIPEETPSACSSVSDITKETN